MWNTVSLTYRYVEDRCGHAAGHVLEGEHAHQVTVLQPSKGDNEFPAKLINNIDRPKEHSPPLTNHPFLCLESGGILLIAIFFTLNESFCVLMF